MTRYDMTVTVKLSGTYATAEDAERAARDTVTLDLAGRCAFYNYLVSVREDAPLVPATGQQTCTTCQRLQIICCDGPEDQRYCSECCRCACHAAMAHLKMRRQT